MFLCAVEDLQEVARGGSAGCVSRNIGDVGDCDDGMNKVGG